MYLRQPCDSCIGNWELQELRLIIMKQPFLDQSFHRSLRTMFRDVVAGNRLTINVNNDMFSNSQLQMEVELSNGVKYAS